MRTTTTPDFRGILRPAAARAAFTLRRHAASAPLAAFVERYWVIEWSLPPGATHVQEVIGYPSVDLVFEDGSGRVWGPRRHRLQRRFAGRGRVLGVKFRPGGFLALARCDVLRVVDRSLPAVDTLVRARPRDISALARQIGGVDDEHTVLADVESWLLGLQPDRGLVSELVNDAVASALHDASVATVEQLARVSDVSVRTLQRLFRSHIGLSPKAVLNRFRLMAAVHAADSRPVRSWADAAMDLGYADQAHLARDFKSRLGITPATYARAMSCDATPTGAPAEHRHARRAPQA